MRLDFSYCFFLFLLLLCSVSCSKEIYYGGFCHSRFTLTQRDTIYIFSLLDGTHAISVKYPLYYTWFSKGTVGYGQGDFTGKLLHGEYVAMLGDKTMVEKGTYHQGLKDGEWYSWYGNGAIKSISNYQRGLLSGPFLHFDMQGQIVKTGAYRKGKPHATWVSYHGPGELLEKDTLHLESYRTISK